MLAPETAWQRISERLSPLGSERRGRAEALGRVLAEDLVVTTEIPAADVSAMDGFAVAGELPAGAIVPIAGTIAAGQPPGTVLPSNAVLRIWTGAPVPHGADRVVPVELTAEIAGEPPRVELRESVGVGAHIRRRGEVLRTGDSLLVTGAHLGPAALALLASQGIDTVEVVRRPRLAILPTGDEVVTADRTPGPGELRDSHSDYLSAAARRIDSVASALEVVGDDPDALRGAVAAALDAHDVVLVCGGVSMGGRDHTEAVFERVGASIVFDGVAIQPGKPLVFAVRDDRLLFGLPGNPASAMVTFRLFVRPALERLAGRRASFWSDARTVELAAPLAAGKSRDRFVPGMRCGRSAAGREVVEPLGVRGSHDLGTFGGADRLLRIRAGAAPAATGDTIDAIEWE